MLTIILDLLTTLPYVQEPQIAALPLLAVAGLASMAIKGGSAAYQGYKAGKVKGTNVPEYGEDMTYFNQANAAYEQRMAKLKTREGSISTVMPGQGRMEEKIGGATSGGITAMREVGNQATFGNTVAQFVQQEQDKLADIGIAAATRKDRLQGEAFDATTQAMKDKEGYLLDFAKEREARKYDKATGKIAEKSALTGAAMQNVSGMVDTGASLAATYYGAGSGRPN